MLTCNLLCFKFLVRWIFSMNFLQNYIIFSRKPFPKYYLYVINRHLGFYPTNF